MQRPAYIPGPLALVSATIVLQLVAAWMLGTVAAAAHTPGLLLAGITVLAAIGLNLLRFVIWGYAHRIYPLSHTYPLTALFFPCVVVLSYLHGEAISASQIGGTLLITLGAFTLNTSRRKKETRHG